MVMDDGTQDRRGPAGRGAQRPGGDRGLSRPSRASAARRERAACLARSPPRGRAAAQARPRRHVLRAGAGAFRPVARGAARADRLPARRQCQRQVHHDEGHPRPGAAARGRGAGSTAQTSPGCRRRRSSARGIGSVPEARRLFGAMTVRENLLMGAYRRRDRARRSRRIYERVLGAVPAACAQRLGAARRHAVRRRAADGGDGARADGPAAADLHGRADDGPLAALSSTACWS